MKNLRFLLCTFFVITLLLTTSYANTQIGNVTTTDIIAYINNCPIRSYNINATTAIIAEDLSHYGFDVIWNNDERTLKITKNPQKDITNQKVVLRPNSANNGAVAMEYYKTDIKTYIEGKEVPGYNINGQTVIMARSLEVYGDVIWDETNRNVLINIPTIKSGKSVEPIGAYVGFQQVPMLEAIGAPNYIDQIVSENERTFVYNGNSVNIEHMQAYFRLLKQLNFNLLESIPPFNDGGIYFSKQNLFGGTTYLSIKTAGFHLNVILYNQ